MLTEKPTHNNKVNSVDFLYQIVARNSPIVNKKRFITFFDLNNEGALIDLI